MYAVIKTGGKQYRVINGETLKVEILPGEVGSAIVLDKVLMVSDGEAAQFGKADAAWRYSQRNHPVSWPWR